MSWRESLPPVYSNQCVLLDRDVKLQEAWLLQSELRTPEHPRRNVLTHPLPDIHLSNIKGIVLLMEDAGSSWKTKTWPQQVSFRTAEFGLLLWNTDMCSKQRPLITFRFFASAEIKNLVYI